MFGADARRGPRRVDGEASIVMAQEPDDVFNRMFGADARLLRSPRGESRAPHAVGGVDAEWLVDLEERWGSSRSMLAVWWLVWEDEEMLQSPYAALLGDIDDGSESERICFIEVGKPVVGLLETSMMYEWCGCWAVESGFCDIGKSPFAFCCKALRRCCQLSGYVMA
jgi:hypothetical protein